MSVIVYSQKELDTALKQSISGITLCAGIFRMPRCCNVVFDRIGPVEVYVDCTKAQADMAGMVFKNIYPIYKGDSEKKYENKTGSAGSGLGLGYGIDLI